MKNTKHLRIRPTLRGLVLALAISALSSYVARAIPYASQVNKSGNTVSFVLNQNAAGLVVLRNGANPVYPGTTAGPLSFDMTGYTSYQIIVTGNTAVGWSQYIPDGADRNFEYPFGVAINKNPSSTNFGRVYVSNSRVGTTGLGRACSDGIYVLRPDGASVTFATGGKTWTGNSAPYKTFVGPDNHLYVADLSNDLAYEFNDDMSAVTALIDASNKTNVVQNPSNDSSQFVNSIYVEGTKAAGNRSIYLVNGNFYDTARKGLIRYDLGANAAATPSDLGTQIIGPTAWHSYYPYDVARDSVGDWYLTTYRGVPNNAPAITKFNGAGALPLDSSILWEVADWATYYYAYCMDVDNVSHQVVYGNNANGNVYCFDAATGNYLQTLAAGSAIRDVAFDIVGNLVTVDNSIEWARFWSPGGYTVATTSSDGTFNLTKPSTDVSVTATTPQTSMDLNQPPGVFTVTRSGNTASALPVGYTLTGTATNGAQYQLLSGTVRFLAGETATNINVTAIPFTPAGPTRSVILILNVSNSYNPVIPASATVWIIDTNQPTIHIAARDTQFYERTNDYARFTLTRYGDTNLYLQQVNLTYSGTAAAGTQYYGDANTAMANGVDTIDVQVHPIHDGVVTGPLTVAATVAASGDGSYAIGTPATSGAVTRVDADDPPETVLFADNFDTDSSANWTLRFAARNGIDDYTTNWAYDYSGAAIPSAPHSPAGSTLGLKLTVNKNEATAGGGAGLNLYPTGRSFSGNYALRFDMFLMVGGTASTTEYALCGINHSGNQTNWFRGPSSANVPNDGAGGTWSYDGVWTSIEADASGTDDYMFMSAPAVTPSGIWGPTTYAASGATPFKSIFKTPPWYAGGVGGGSPANAPGYPTPIWADVEMSQIGDIVTLKIDHSVILSYTNTTVAAHSGNIMIGYDDAYDSIMSGDSSVIIDNLRVVSLAAPVITKIVNNAGNIEITFTANSGDVVAQFALQLSTPLVTGAYADTTSTITSLGGGVFKAVKAAGAGPAFYRIRRIQ